jgi:serine/threonine protein kinase
LAFKTPSIHWELPREGSAQYQHVIALLNDNCSGPLGLSLSVRLPHGTLPFEYDWPELIEQQIIAGLPDLLNAPELVHISGQCGNLMERMLEKDPARRIGAQEALEHEWFAGMSENQT